ncbi:unnamed protein product, partial [Linum tenue]
FPDDSSSKIRLPAANPAAVGQEPPQRRSLPTLREQDQYMPIANVIRIMRRILPAHAKISDDAKETIQECVSEYISFVTGEANERCQREQRKTVTADDVIWAMGKLGFDSYVEPLSRFLARYRETEGDRASYRDPMMLKRSSNDFGGMVMPPPPLPPQQQQMVGYMQGNFLMQGDHLQQQQQQGMYDGGVLNGYYRDPFGSGSGSGSGEDGGGTSQNGMSGFDLYSHYK